MSKTAAATAIISENIQISRPNIVPTCGAGEVLVNVGAESVRYVDAFVIMKVALVTVSRLDVCD